MNRLAHPTVPVRHGEWSADVDAELADVVLELWRAGIATVSACQDEGESLLDLPGTSSWLQRDGARYLARSYVDLLNVADTVRLFDAIANAGPRDDMYARMSSPAEPDAWEVRITLYDALPTLETFNWSSPSTFTTGIVRVRFPRSDAPAVATRLRRWNEGNTGPHTAPL